jgi:tetratricopeptide (TPR) repeat protein
LHGKIAEIYARTGHPDGQAVELAKENLAPCGAATAECEYAAGHFEAAAAALETAPDALYWRAAAMLELARRAAARLQELPPSRESYQALAEVEERSARYREAAEAWRKALEHAPGEAQLQRRLALALCHGNDCAAALPLLRDLTAGPPSSAELNYLHGLALNATREPGRAVPYLEKAIRLDPKLLAARAALGEAYLQTGNIAGAVAQLEAAAAEDETGSRHYQLARALQAAGRQEQAREALRAYREIQSRRETAQQDDPGITPP